MVEEIAAFRGQVWILTDEGRLVSLARGERRAMTAYESGVVELLATQDGVWALRSDGGPGRFSVARLAGGARPQSPPLSLPPNQPLVAFAEADGRLIAVTESSIAELTPEGWRISPLVGRLRPRFPHPPQLSHAVAGHILYVGYNQGEWGGGLQMLDLRSRVVSDVEDGLFTVTGLAPDPRRPGCVFASSGLWHFGASGEVARICGTRKEGTVLHRSLAQRGWSEQDSEPFFGLVQHRGRVWAVSPLGLSQLDDPAAEHVALPRRALIDGLPVSFAARGFVIAWTSNNRRHSMSGATPLVAGLP